MNKWNEMKEWVEIRMKEADQKQDYVGHAMYTRIIHNMFKLESEEACQSLKEAGC